MTKMRAKTASSEYILPSEVCFASIRSDRWAQDQFPQLDSFKFSIALAFCSKSGLLENVRASSSSVSDGGER